MCGIVEVYFLTDSHKGPLVGILRDKHQLDWPDSLAYYVTWFFGLLSLFELTFEIVYIKIPSDSAKSRALTASTPTTQTNLVWRRTALVIWGLIALSYLAFYLIDLRLDFIQIQSPCQGVGCNWMAISSSEAAIWQSWGLSTQVYAAFMTGSTVLTAAVYWLLGGLIL